MDLTALERFETSKSAFKLTKIKSKRASAVEIGQTAIGYFSLIRAIDCSMVCVFSHDSWIRTSFVAKIISSDETSTTFETQGGVYKLEEVAN